jgi:triphosphatase
VALEVELKFALEASPGPEGLEDLLGRAGFVVRALGMARQRDVYFDTPSGKLAKEGYALRQRSVENERLATLKHRGTVSEGLHRREEVELPMPDEAWPELIRQRLTGLIDLSALEPTVELITTRSKLIVSETGRLLAECALDEVEARRPGSANSVRFAELELEALAGAQVGAQQEAPLRDVEDLKRVAAALQAKVKLQPSALNKLERAQALLGAKGRRRPMSPPGRARGRCRRWRCR